MPTVKRKKFIHNTILAAKPDDLISVKIDIPAHLLKKSVRTHGDTTKTIHNALKMAQNRKHINNLVEILSEIKKNIELLEEDKSCGELDELHILLIENYKDVYLRLKQAEILRRRRKA